MAVEEKKSYLIWLPIIYFHATIEIENKHIFNNTKNIFSPKLIINFNIYLTIICGKQKC